MHSSEKALVPRPDMVHARYSEQLQRTPGSSLAWLHPTAHVGRTQSNRWDLQRPPSSSFRGCGQQHRSTEHRRSAGSCSAHLTSALHGCERLRVFGLPWPALPAAPGAGPPHRLRAAQSGPAHCPAACTQQSVTVRCKAAVTRYQGGHKAHKAAVTWMPGQSYASQQAWKCWPTMEVACCEL